MLTFVLSVIAGFATPFVEPFLTKLIQPRLDEFPVHEGEYRTITFVLLLLGVAIAAISSGVMVSAFTVLFGLERQSKFRGICLAEQYRASIP